MDATLILIDSAAELSRARALVDRLWDSDEPADVARLQAQARLIEAYEATRWPRRQASTAALICHLMDQHDLSRADMAPILGTPSRVQRGAPRQKRAEHGDGAAPACALPHSSRSFAAAAEEVARAPPGQAGRRIAPGKRAANACQARVRASQIFQAHAAAAPHAFACFLDSPQKARTVFQPIFEPVVLRLEPDQHAGWLTVPCNDDVALCRFTRQRRQVVLDLGERNLPHAGFPN